MNLFFNKSLIVGHKNQSLKWVPLSRPRTLKNKYDLIDIMNCIDSISEQEFKLEQVYKFENILKRKHPTNNFIKDKIRQQLQILRDKGIIEFVSRGVYRKI